MTESDRAPYMAKALEEQSFREEAMRCPHQSKFLRSSKEQSGLGDTAENLPRSGLKAVSRQRMMASYTAFRESAAWRQYEGGIGTPDGCIALDDIDMETDLSTIQRMWEDFVKPEAELPAEFEPPDHSVHHSTCRGEFGKCKSSYGVNLATKYVHSMASLLQEGGWASLRLVLPLKPWKLEGQDKQTDCTPETTNQYKLKLCCYFFKVLAHIGFYDLAIQGLILPGTLLQLKVDGLAACESFFFVGTAMKKPRLHVLIQGFPISAPAPASECVSIVHPDSGRPVMYLSHELFQRLIEMLQQPKLATIPFVIHEFQIKAFGPLLFVSITNTSSLHEFVAAKKGVLKQNATTTRLPFGLKHSPRKRNRKRKLGVQGQDHKDYQPSKKEPAKAATASKLPTTLLDIEQELRKCDPESSSDSSGSESESSGSESSGSVASSDHDSEASDSGPVYQQDRPAEEPFLTSEALEEEREIHQVLDRHAKLLESRGEVFDHKGAAEASTLEVEPEPPEPALERPKAASATRTAGAGTFCNSKVGLIEAGVQVSRKQATCKHCGSKIAIQGVRFGYSYSRVKFHAWIHSRCLLQYLVSQDADLQQALDFLDDQVLNNASLLAEVRAEIQVLQPELRGRLSHAKSSAH